MDGGRDQKALHKTGVENGESETDINIGRTIGQIVCLGHLEDRMSI